MTETREAGSALRCRRQRILGRGRAQRGTPLPWVQSTSDSPEFLRHNQITTLIPVRLQASSTFAAANPPTSSKREHIDMSDIQASTCSGGCTRRSVLLSTVLLKQLCGSSSQAITVTEKLAANTPCRAGSRALAASSYPLGTATSWEMTGMGRAGRLASVVPISASLFLLAASRVAAATAKP